MTVAFPRGAAARFALPFAVFRRVCPGSAGVATGASGGALRCGWSGQLFGQYVIVSLSARYLYRQDAYTRCRCAGAVQLMCCSSCPVDRRDDSTDCGRWRALPSAEDSYQDKQVDEFMSWCAEHSIKSDHLYRQHEWRW